MATPKKKKIKKNYSYKLDVFRWYDDHTPVDHFLEQLRNAFATIAVDMENDGIEGDALDNIGKVATIWADTYDGSIDVYVCCSAVIEKMETQKQAELREARAEKAKKTKEENARKKREKDMRVLEKLRKMYG